MFIRERQDSHPFGVIPLSVLRIAIPVCYQPAEFGTRVACDKYECLVAYFCAAVKTRDEERWPIDRRD